MDLDKTNERETAQEKTEETETHLFVHSGVFDSIYFISQEIKKNLGLFTTLYILKNRKIWQCFLHFSQGLKNSFFFGSAYMYKINFHYLELLSPSKREGQISTIE